MPKIDRYNIPEPNFELDNAYIFDFQVGFVNLYDKEAELKSEEDEYESEEETSKRSSEKTSEIEEGTETAGATTTTAEAIAKEIGGESEPEIPAQDEAIMDEDEWLNVDLEALQINEMTTEADYKTFFMNGIELKTEINKIVVSTEVKGVLHALDKIKTTREGLIAQIEKLYADYDVISTERNETVENEYELFEISDNKAKNVTVPEGYLDTLDVEDLPLPPMKKVIVTLPLYDIKVIQVEEERFVENIPADKCEEGEEEEEDFDTDYVYKIDDCKLIPVPELPVDEHDISQARVSKRRLRKRSVTKVIASMPAEKMIEKMENTPLLIDVSEFDLLSKKPITTIGICNLGLLGNRFVDIVKANAKPGGQTPHTCVKDRILPIIDSEGVNVGEIKISLKLKCYNQRAWPYFPNRLPETPSYVALMETGPQKVESIQELTSDATAEEMAQYGEDTVAEMLRLLYY